MTGLIEGALDDSLAPLAFLLGTWEGRGRAEYPSMDPTVYAEQLRFEHVGDTFLLYDQSSWSPDDGAPIHFERGFLRFGEPGRIELTLAHPLGLTEISEGDLVGTAFELTSTDVGRTTTGMGTTAVVRRYRVDGGVLTYETTMATERTPMTIHLAAELRRVLP